MILSKYYKSAMDKIVMTEELKNKILNNASPKKSYKNYYKYSSFAACFIMAICSVFITKYINIPNNRTPDVSVETTNSTETTTIYFSEITTEITTYHLDNKLEINKKVVENKKEENNVPETEIITNISDKIDELNETTTIENIETEPTTTELDLVEENINELGIYDNDNFLLASPIINEEKIEVKEPLSRNKFSLASHYYAGSLYGRGGNSGYFISKKQSETYNIPEENIIVEPVYATETQYYEMVNDIEELMGFDFETLPYDENAKICAAINGNTIVIRYIYDDDYITFCAEKGALNCSHDSSIHYKTEKKEGITLKSDGTNYYLGIYAKLPVSYSICSYNGVTKEKMIELFNNLN